MATRTIKTDDLDGSEATQSVTIVLAGVRYNLDLNDKHAEEFTKDMASWLKAAAEKKESGPKKPDPVLLDGKPVSKAAVRAWAREQGKKVGDFYVSPTLIREYVEHVTGAPVAADAAIKAE